MVFGDVSIKLHLAIGKSGQCNESRQFESNASLQAQQNLKSGPLWHPGDSLLSDPLSGGVTCMLQEKLVG